MDAGPWTLGHGRWARDAGPGTLGQGRWARGAGAGALGQGRWGRGALPSHLTSVQLLFSSAKSNNFGLLRFNRYKASTKPTLMTSLDHSIVAVHYFHPAMQPWLGKGKIESLS